MLGEVPVTQVYSLCNKAINNLHTICYQETTGRVMNTFDRKPAP